MNIMEGQKIRFSDGKIEVSNNPIIPFIEGDGIGIDIWPASKIVLMQLLKKHMVEKENNMERSFSW